LLEGIIKRVWRKIIKVEAPVKQKGWEDDLLRTYSSWKEDHWRSALIDENWSWQKKKQGKNQTF